MRLRWAKSISTFFRRFCAVTLNSDAVHWRAKSRTISHFFPDGLHGPLSWGSTFPSMRTLSPADVKAFKRRKFQ